MKKTLCTLCVIILTTVSSWADEGMWLLPLLSKMNAGAMADLGCRLTPNQIYDINNSSLKDAVVIFGGGCTGEMISEEGLLVTNHHCGYSTIQSLSSTEHNYLEDGYWAMSRSQEIPAPGLSVTFLISMEDVTRAILKAAEKGKEAENEFTEKLIKDATDLNPGSHATITGFYNQNVKYLIIYKTYTDIRFVGAPPASSGKFGGETDNWMWPRHTCDFSMFRVYAGKDNQPADYSKDNVPYVPKKALKVSLKGYNEGDFAMIMGYPGSTRRFQTAAQLQDMIETNDIRIAARTVRQNVMWKEMRADDKVSLQYASKYASSSNGWKKWIGMRQSFGNLDIIGRELQKENDFMTWVGKKKKRTEKYGSSIATIEDCVKSTAETRKASTLFSESVSRIELTLFCNSVKRNVMNFKNKGDDEATAFAKAIALLDYKDYSEAVDRKEAAALLDFYRQNAKKENYLNIEGWDFATMDINAYVDQLFDNSAFTSAEKVKTLTDMESAGKDPAVGLLNALADASRKVYGNTSDKTADETLAQASKAFTAGLMEWKSGEPSYPDANFTMRLTYGNVKGYSPKDGVQYRYYTTLKGVMEKEDPGNYEFRVPAKVKQIYQSKDYGQYADANGELPTCFLINCDITGGNSGSPVMDADGNLIGLAFDGNWESMSSDVMFEPDLQRCICVDIRYVLMMLDKFGGAGYLLNEMTLVK